MPRGFCCTRRPTLMESNARSASAAFTVKATARPYPTSVTALALVRGDCNEQNRAGLCDAPCSAANVRTPAKHAPTQPASPRTLRRPQTPRRLPLIRGGLGCRAVPSADHDGWRGRLRVCAWKPPVTPIVHVAFRRLHYQGEPDRRRLRRWRQPGAVSENAQGRVDLPARASCISCLLLVLGHDESDSASGTTGSAVNSGGRWFNVLL
jgi:hypothetical protein